MNWIRRVNRGLFFIFHTRLHGHTQAVAYAVLSTSCVGWKEWMFVGAQTIPSASTSKQLPVRMREGLSSGCVLRWKFQFNCFPSKNIKCALLNLLIVCTGVFFLAVDEHANEFKLQMNVVQFENMLMAGRKLIAHLCMVFLVSMLLKSYRPPERT